MKDIQKNAAQSDWRVLSAPLLSLGLQLKWVEGKQFGYDEGVGLAASDRLAFIFGRNTVTNWIDCWVAERKDTELEVDIGSLTTIATLHNLLVDRGVNPTMQISAAQKAGQSLQVMNIYASLIYRHLLDATDDVIQALRDTAAMEEDASNRLAGR
jgi:hypothetical protein